MKILSLEQCIEILEYLKDGQCRVEIIGEEWYDGDMWHVVIKDPMHDIMSEALTTYPQKLVDTLNQAIYKLRNDRNGRNLLFGYFKGKKLELQAK